jgi:hypothetical protein
MLRELQNLLWRANLKEEQSLRGLVKSEGNTTCSSLLPIKQGNTKNAFIKKGKIEKLFPL